MNYTGSMILFIFLVQLAAYTLKWLIGFGNPLISAPLLAMRLDNTLITPGSLLPDLVINGRITWQSRNNFRWRAILPLLLAMVVMYTLGQSTVNLFIALSLTSWASVARVVRSQTLSLKESEYVEAARSIGVSNGKIMLKHILPNCIPSLIVLFTLNVPSAILSESSLSFLGIGAQPPAASWGLMVNQSKQFLFTQPWLALAPCIAIMIVVLAFNFLGDGLRDVLDPYMKNQ
jgi:ABC-type microcin C transport system permease subunit YejE